MRIIRLLPIFVVKEYERGIFELFGKYVGFTGPGLKVMIPIVHVCRIRDTREHTMDIPPQSVITKDNVEIRVDGIIWAKPIPDEPNITKTFYEIDNWQYAVMELAMSNLRQEFGNLTLDESLISREKISQDLQRNLDKLTDNWGVRVSKVEMRLIDPPGDIKEAMHKQKTAEQERRSMRLLATGKYEAAKQEKLAAIQKAEGERESAILRAEGAKKAEVLRSEGDQIAQINVAHGESEGIRMVSNSAQTHFKGAAQKLKQLQVTEESLKRNSKVILTEKGISPQIIVGDIPTTGTQAHK
jgi:regulator of protease activity HflC (stomatin/prohibitin superfamily)